MNNSDKAQREPCRWQPPIARKIHVQIENESENGEGLALYFCGWYSRVHIDTVKTTDKDQFEKLVELLNKTVLIAYDGAFYDEQCYRDKHDLVIADLNDLRPECFTSSSPKSDEK